MLSFLFSPVFARNNDLSDLKSSDLSDLKEKYKQYTGGKSSSVSSKKIEDLNVEPPKSRFIDTSTPELTPEDKRHVLLHKKLANRHFAKKNYDKAIEEVNSVFSRDSSNSGGHFMYAVISARKKDYNPAWYHISIAKEKDSGNSKIDDFIKKLKTVSSEPQNPGWVTGIYNGIQTDASDRTFDLIEKLLQDECSQNITSIQTTEYKSEGTNNSGVEITFKARDQFNPDKIVLALRKVNPAGAGVKNTSNNNLEMRLSFRELSAEKTTAKPINIINDFINDLTEQFPEVAISNTDEGEPQNGIQEIVYEISVREFSTLNQFFRKISPYATKYVLQNMELAYLPGSESTIWKAKVKVSYKVKD